MAHTAGGGNRRRSAGSSAASEVIITELAAMLPMRVIGMLLGIPEQDQVAVRNKTDDNLRTVPGEAMNIKEEEIASGAMFGEYID